MTVDKLKHGDTHITRTWKYFGFTLRDYGQGFVDNLRKLFCAGTYMNDHHFIKLTGEVYNKHLFLVLDIDESKDFYETLEYLRSTDAYELDYSVDHPTLNLHVLVVKLPKRFESAMEHFVNSEYSKMYDPKDLDNLLLEHEKQYGFYKILTNDMSHLKKFEKAVNDKIGTDEHSSWVELKADDVDELDFKIELTDEILNYDTNITLV